MTTDALVVREVVAFLAQAIIVVVGWIVVDKLSARREMEKARREILARSADELATTVDRLMLDSRSYHLSARDERTEIGLKMALQDVALRTAALSDLCGDIAQLGACRSGAASFRRAITGTHFEDEHSEPLSLHSEQLELIASEALRARQSYVKLKHRQYSLTVK